MIRSAILTILLIVGRPSPVRADGVPISPEAWWRAWNWDPFILFNFAILAWLYTQGLARLWRSAGLGRGVSRARAVGWFGAWAVLLLVLVSPLDALGEELSSAHMVQHMVLTSVAAPLFVAGAPAFVLTWGLPRDWRPWMGATPLSADSLWQPLFVWVLFAAALWAWHLPLLYQAALRDLLVHDAQHLSFFVASCFFWRLLLDPLGRRRLHPVVAVLFLFTTSLHATALGVFMALSPRLWYADYATTTLAWGLTPLEDQQLAGLIMWVPACLAYPAVAAVLFGVWLSNPARRTFETASMHRRGTHGGRIPSCNSQ